MNIKSKNIIVENLFLCSKTIAKFKLSTSNRFDKVFDQKIYSRVNKTLHYKSMLYFKSSGFLVYDLGGVSIKEEPEKLNIKKFKKDFVIKYKHTT